MLTALSDARIPYLLVSGLAVNFYGVPRMTMDIDFVVSPRREDIEKLVGTLASLGYRPQDLSDVAHLERRGYAKLSLEEKPE